MKYSIGDKVEVIVKDKTYTGVVMPTPELAEKNILILKLDNGYNIGVAFKGSILEKSKHREPKAIEEEEEFELGKVKKSLLKIKFNPRNPPISMLSVGGTIHKGYKDSETLKDIRRQEEEQLEKMQQQKAIEQAKLYDNIKKYAPIIAIGGAGLIGSILVLK